MILRSPSSSCAHNSSSVVTFKTRHIFSINFFFLKKYKMVRSGRILRWVGSLCNKRHELAENFLSLILINLVPKVASNCE